jgi:DNA-binding IclR family transcriptional regulator
MSPRPVRTPARAAPDQPDVVPGGTAASGVKSADRLMTLLEYLADVGPVTFQTITRDLGLPNSSAHQLLLNVTQRGFAEYDDVTRTYRLGVRVWELGQAYNQAADLPALSQPLMDALVQTVGETVQLGRLDGTEEVHIAVSETWHPVKLYSVVGLRLPAHVTGIGKALLSGLTDEQIRSLYSGMELKRFTDKTITNVEALIAAVDKIRRRGQAEDNEEYAVGCRCFARPIRDADGAVIAAMSVSVPTPRYSPALGVLILKSLASTVREVEAKLGRLPH